MRTKQIPIQDQPIRLGRMGQIRHANQLLEKMGSSFRIGNLMNPALRQSQWDSSNLDNIDEDSQ